MYSGLDGQPHAAGARGRPVARARSLSEFQASFPDETSRAAFPIRATLARGFCLPRLWQRTRGIAEEPGAHLRMPRLRSSDVDHGWHSDAPVQIAADSVVLGRASHGNPLEWHVGTPVRGPARHHIQDRLVAGAEAATIDDRSSARAAGGRGRG